MNIFNRQSHLTLFSTKALPGYFVATMVLLLGACGGQTAPNPSSSSSSNASSSSSASTSSSSSSSSSSSTSSSSSSSSGEINLPLVVAINAGGQAGNFDGMAFDSDQYFRGGSTSSTTDPINGTTDDGLYQSERYGSYSYEVPVSNATYSVKLYFAEIFNDAAGARAFNLSIEGSEELNNIDLFSLAGHDGAYSYEVNNISVSDGTLSIALESLIDNGTLSGFAVYSATGQLEEPVITPGGARTMGYVGCSMSVNVSEGYQMLGGERLWPPIGQYNGQVVQNWANSNDGVWGAFENAARQYGTPTDVWVMLCIFDNQVTVQEAQQIVANVRQRAPNANIYITGQPLYNDPNSCFLAGNGGPDKTDRIARETAAISSLNITYQGALGPLSASQNSDGCHANDAGRRLLGQQFIDWFGL